MRETEKERQMQRRTLEEGDLPALRDKEMRENERQSNIDRDQDQQKDKE